MSGLSVTVLAAGIAATAFLFVNAALSYVGHHRRALSDMRLLSAGLSGLLTVVAVSVVAQVGL